VRFRLRDRVQRAAGRIEEMDSGLQCGKHLAAALAERDAADHRGQHRVAHLAVGGIPALERRPAAVDPPQHLLAIAPQRAFAQPIGAFYDNVHGLRYGLPNLNCHCRLTSGRAR